MTAHSDKVERDRSGLQRTTTVVNLATTCLMALAALAILRTSLWPGGSDGAGSESGRVVRRPKDPVSLAGSQTIGRQAAKLVVIEYADFECPACAKFARQIFPRLRLDYVDTGKVRPGQAHSSDRRQVARPLQ